LKIKLTNKILFVLILLYPIILGFIYAFNVSPFFITAPYFSIIIFLILIRLIQKRKIYIPKKSIIDVLLCLFIVLISLLNYSSIRYSLPIFFAIYIFVFQLYTVFVATDSYKGTTKAFLFSYLVLSIIFYGVFDFTQMAIGDRFIGFTGSPTTYAAVMAMIYILVDKYLINYFYKRLFLYLLIFLFVLLSKTRLVILFLIIYPVLFYFINKKKFTYSSVFIVAFLILFFVYPIYTIVVDVFPELVTMRYEDKRDASFGLRNHLYNLVQTDFQKGSLWELLFGKGNEHSRLLIHDVYSMDLFPHNDFIRVLNDWGIVGGGVFFIYLLRLAKNNIVALMVSILYMILFYSNMIFNLFIISILILVSLDHDTKISKDE